MTFPLDLTADEIKICHQTNTSVEDAQFLKSLTGRPVELLLFDTQYGKAAQTKGIYSYMDDKKGKQAVLDNYDRFQNEGKLLFLGDWELLDEKRTIINGVFSLTGNGCKMIGLLSTTSDPYELIKLMDTFWANCDIDAERLIKKAKAWDKKFGVKIYQVANDNFAALIIEKNIDYLALATEIHEMCTDPDNTDTTIEERAEQIKKSGEIYLWWD